ncbi:hypothetical protein [Stenotrophomonas bentonitica]|uniref:hypothetical protein n=1 Tax=Stenotrophomonas bentonitica TaxID=1450134 RepID=UPI00345E18F9
MIKETLIATICAASIAATGLANAARVDDRSVCLQSLSATGRPILSGLKEVKVDANDGSSTEGGEYRFYLNSRGILVYVVATQYGETGRKVFLYKLLDGSAHSYSVTVSSYRYVEPIHAGAVKVAGVDTSSLVVCDEAVVKQGGFEGVSRDMAGVARSILSNGLEAYNAIKPNKGASRD